MHLESAEAVRSSVQKKFRELSPDDISARSSALIQRFLKAVPSDWRGQKIALYRSMKYEVQLGDLEKALLELGAKLYYPKILDEKTCDMCFEPETPSRPGSMPVLVPINDIDIFIVPGLAFGRQGERIGRGKGYYDRCLARNTKALRLALIFDFQLFPSLQQNSWDQRVQWIATESEDLHLETL
jgi:5-formyltetrahydrofolate cyclo-ligase